MNWTSRIPDKKDYQCLKMKAAAINGSDLRADLSVAHLQDGEWNLYLCRACLCIVTVVGCAAFGTVVLQYRKLEIAQLLAGATHESRGEASTPAEPSIAADNTRQ